MRLLLKGEVRLYSEHSRRNSLSMLLFRVCMVHMASTSQISCTLASKHRLVRSDISNATRLEHIDTNLLATKMKICKLRYTLEEQW